MYEIDKGGGQGAGSTIRAHHWMGSSRYAARELVTLAFRRARLILALFLLIAVAGVAASMQVKTLYPAEARIMVLPSRDYVMRQDVGAVGPLLGLDQNHVVRTEIEIITSRTMIEKVIDAVGLQRLYPELSTPESGPTALLEQAMAAVKSLLGSQEGGVGAEKTLLSKAEQVFTKNLSVTPVKDANVITLVFSHPDRTIAAETANALVDAYLDRRRAVLAQPRTDLFSNKRAEYAERLQAIETAIQTFKSENRISSFPDQKSLLLRQHAELSSERLDTQTRLAEAEGRLAALRETLKTTPQQIELYAESSAQDSRDTARAMLVTLEMRRNELLTKFHEKSRYVTDLDDQIAQLRAILSSTPSKQAEIKRMGRNSVYDQLVTSVTALEAEVASLRQRAASLTEKVEGLGQRLAAFDQVERRHNELVLQRQLVEDNLKVYTQKLEEATIVEELDRQKTANVRVVQNAQPAADGRSLKLVLALLSMVGGAIVAMTLAFWIEIKRDFMVTPEAAERAVKLAVLVAVPYRAGLDTALGAKRA